jgi:hypothetical protein
MDRADAVFVRGSADRYAQEIRLGISTGLSDARQKASTLVELLPVSIAEEREAHTVSPAFLRPLEVARQQFTDGGNFLPARSGDDSTHQTTTFSGTWGIMRKVFQRISIGGCRTNCFTVLFALALLAALISKFVLSTSGASIDHIVDTNAATVAEPIQLSKKSSFLDPRESGLLQYDAIPQVSRASFR